MENTTQTLKERMESFRKEYDYTLPKRSYTMIFCDGRSFSKLIKNKFEKPFDDWFINAMNQTAKYICENVQGAKFAYVQSDEISVVLTDFDNEETEAFYGNRLCKLQSIIASLATCKFNQLLFAKMVQDDKASVENVMNMQLVQFDCKAWNLPTFNDVYAWFLYRQTDCIRNSKQQTAQTYLPHKMLNGIDTDKQVALLKEVKDIDWNTFSDDKKYGRFVERREVEATVFNNYTKQEINVVRKEWIPSPAYLLKDNRDRFIDTSNIPIKEE
jgi:tRNA(His) 5'-end guanylyltransferase